MNIAKVLHTQAMELADEALLAQMEGNSKAAQTFFQKAFWLEKEAAVDYGAEIADELIRFLYLRGAAFLAFKAGNINEAEQLVNVTLSKNPPHFIREQLKDLTKQIKSTKGTIKNSKTIHLVGILMDAYGGENKIKIQNSIDDYLIIFVPHHLLEKVVTAYWMKKVEVEASSNSKGIIVLKKIKLVA